SPFLAAVDCLRSSSEADEGVATRHVWRLAGGDQLVGVQRHVALDLVGNRLVALSPERKEQAVEPARDGHHFPACPGARNLARMAVVWSHSRAARSTCRRPARVSV